MKFNKWFSVLVAMLLSVVCSFTIFAGEHYSSKTVIIIENGVVTDFHQSNNSNTDESVEPDDVDAKVNSIREYINQRVEEALKKSSENIMNPEQDEESAIETYPRTQAKSWLQKFIEKFYRFNKERLS